MFDDECIWNQLRTVIDPEIRVNIVDLGMVYAVDVVGRHVRICMTLTTPTCPMGDAIMSDVKTAVNSIYPSADVDVELVWDPPWNKDMITELGQMELGWI